MLDANGVTWCRTGLDDGWTGHRPLSSVSMDLTRRTDYRGIPLTEDTVDPDPVTELRKWIEDADATGVEEHNAMVLATVDATGKPSLRNVLLRGLTDEGVMKFFTNYDSHKAHEIASNPNVSVLFSWLSLRRQVRVRGYAMVLSAVESDEYFAARPRETQIGAWASHQSTVIASREQLEARVAEMHERFGDGPIPRPRFWGGYGIAPTSYEFWQGQADRLHDRIRYWRSGSGWKIERLSP